VTIEERYTWIRKACSEGMMLKDALKQQNMSPTTYYKFFKEDKNAKPVRSLVRKKEPYVETITAVPEKEHKLVCIIGDAKEIANMIKGLL
jgi:hypothetical protein